jgi:hypothetical protein
MPIVVALAKGAVVDTTKLEPTVHDTIAVLTTPPPLNAANRAEHASRCR